MDFLSNPVDRLHGYKVVVLKPVPVYATAVGYKKHRKGSRKNRYQKYRYLSHYTDYPYLKKGEMILDKNSNTILIHERDWIEYKKNNNNNNMRTNNNNDHRNQRESQIRQRYFSTIPYNPFRSKGILTLDTY